MSEVNQTLWDPNFVNIPQQRLRSVCLGVGRTHMAIVEGNTWNVRVCWHGAVFWDKLTTLRIACNNICRSAYDAGTYRIHVVKLDSQSVKLHACRWNDNRTCMTRCVLGQVVHLINIDALADCRVLILLQVSFEVLQSKGNCDTCELISASDRARRWCSPKRRWQLCQQPWDLLNSCINLF